MASVVVWISDIFNMDYLGSGNGSCHSIDAYGTWINSKQLYYIEMVPTFRRTDFTKRKYDFGATRATLSINIKNGIFIKAFPENEYSLHPATYETTVLNNSSLKGRASIKIMSANFVRKRSRNILMRTRCNTTHSFCTLSGTMKKRVWDFEPRLEQSEKYLIGPKKLFTIAQVQKEEELPKSRIEFFIRDYLILSKYGIVTGLEAKLSKLFSPFSRILYNPIILTIKKMNRAQKILSDNINRIDSYQKLPLRNFQDSFSPFISNPFLRDKSIGKSVIPDEYYKVLETNIDNAIKCGDLKLIRW